MRGPLLQVLQIAVVSRILRELRLAASLLSPLLAHAEAVRIDSEHLRLVSTGDAEHVLARHTADSLLFAVARAPEPGERWVDVGSGAGFPGLVLACCYASTRFTLVEAQRRRAGFLELQRAQLGLENVHIINARATDVQAGFDVAVARALAEPLLAIEALRRLSDPDGTIIVAVGPSATPQLGIEDLDVARPGVDSPGRLFMIAGSARGA